MKTPLLEIWIVCGYFLANSVTPAVAAVAKANDEAEEWVDPKAVLEMGNKRDKSKVQELRRLKARGEKHKDSPATNAQMALAKMGEEQEVQEIVTESKSEDPAVQSEAIEKLRYVASKRAVRELVGLLDHPAKYRRNRSTGSDGQVRGGHVIFGPPSYQAMQALTEIVSDPPKYNKKRPTKDDIATWKEWWKVNRQKYE